MVLYFFIFSFICFFFFFLGGTSWEKRSTSHKRKRVAYDGESGTAKSRWDGMECASHHRHVVISWFAGPKGYYQVWTLRLYNVWSGDTRDAQVIY